MKPEPVKTKPEARPVLHLANTRAERILEAVAAVGLLATIGYVAWAWPGLPDRVPSHFGIAGTADAWSSRAGLWFLPGVGVALYVLFTVLRGYPHLFNYPTAITSENAPRQYRVARSLLQWLKVWLVWSLGYVSLSQVQVALGKAAGLGVWFLPVFLAGDLGIVAAHLVLLGRSPAKP